MLSIFILIGAYRYYAGLAEAYRKTKWHYGVLAIAIYIGSQLMFGVLYGAYLIITDPSAANNMNYTGFSLVNFLGWIVSVIIVYLVYLFLKKKFKLEAAKKPLYEIDEIGKGDPA
ncbi:hypothetical protein ASG31_13295 [Chryseobacterium sp. Leaf404]|uniref:hypothetical protein n=1 Tax=unclassified Chryseobacterium TaxID=2593645 RepID=UPI0006F232A0|nr:MULTISPECIES: hypothetical protein [unclassified Chryseobacterium]KQT16481.1 hypothetical protein ASG31_13295 [Chryseobacterium sp. Leaf404]